MKILITGGTGFLGSKLAENFSREKHEIGVITRTNQKSNYKTFTLKENFENISEILKEFRPEIVYHLATKYNNDEKSEDIKDMVRVNIEYPSLLLNAMDEVGCKLFINSSTFWKNYDSPLYNPVNFYAATKQAFEDICQYYSKAKGFRILNYIMFDNYGDDDKRLKFLNQLKHNIEKKTVLDITAGNQEILLVHTDDVISAYKIGSNILFNSDEGLFQTYTIGEKKNILKVKDLIYIIEKILGISGFVNLGKKEYRKREVFKIYIEEKLLKGWKQSISIEEGLLRFFRGNHDN